MSQGMRFPPGGGFNDRRETTYSDDGRYRGDTQDRGRGFGGRGDFGSREDAPHVDDGWRVKEEPRGDFRSREVNPYFDDRWRIRDGDVSGWGGFRGQGAAPQPENRRRSREEASDRGDFHGDYRGDVSYSDDRKRFKEEIPEGRGHFSLGGGFGFRAAAAAHPDDRRRASEETPERGVFRSRDSGFYLDDRRGRNSDESPVRGGFSSPGGVFRSREAMASPEDDRRFEEIPDRGGFRGRHGLASPEESRRFVATPGRRSFRGREAMVSPDDNRRFDEIPGRGGFRGREGMASPEDIKRFDAFPDRGGFRGRDAVASPEEIRRFELFPGRGGFRGREGMASPEDSRRLELFPGRGGFRDREAGPHANDWRQANENTRGRQQLFPPTSGGFRGRPFGLDAKGRVEKPPRQGDGSTPGGIAVKLEDTLEDTADKVGRTAPVKLEGAASDPGVVTSVEKGAPVKEEVVDNDGDDDEDCDDEDASSEEEEGGANKLSPYGYPVENLMVKNPDGSLVPRYTHPIPCWHCPRTFQGYGPLKRHLAIHREPNSKAVPCPHCGAVYSPKMLNRHLRAHTGEKPSKCPYPGCEAAFAKNKKLIVHFTQVHGAGEKFHCSVCGRHARIVKCFATHQQADRFK